jgi:hypothetical protein
MLHDTESGGRPHDADVNSPEDDPHLIKPAFLKTQKRKTQNDKRVSPFLRRLLASTIDRAAREHYGDAYCMKCVQTSQAMSRLLTRVDVRSKVWVGAFCAPEVFHDTALIKWGGFWGDEHHAWVVTEFSEVIDLSIAELVHHPCKVRSDGIPLPTVWWDDIGEQPSVIRYLPDTPIKASFADPAETADYDAFLGVVDALWNESLSTYRVDELHFMPMLEGPASMNRFHEAGHPWFVKAVLFQDRAVPFPDWISNRESEIAESSRRGERPPTRLAHLLGLRAV